jgi:hypothetical protein
MVDRCVSRTFSCRPAVAPETWGRRLAAQASGRLISCGGAQVNQSGPIPGLYRDGARLHASLGREARDDPRPGSCGDAQKSVNQGIASPPAPGREAAPVHLSPSSPSPPHARPPDCANSPLCITASDGASLILETIFGCLQWFASGGICLR